MKSRKPFWHDCDEHIITITYNEDGYREVERHEVCAICHRIKTEYVYGTSEVCNYKPKLFVNDSEWKNVYLKSQVHKDYLTRMIRKYFKKEDN